MKPITAFVTETIHTLNISIFAEAELHAQEKIFILLQREKKSLIFFWKSKFYTSKTIY